LSEGTGGAAVPPTTTTEPTTEGVAAVAEPLVPAPDERPAPDRTEPVTRAAAPIEPDDADSFPLLPVAGGAAVAALAGVWWMVGLKKTAAVTAAQSGWNIPHGGTRPPQ
jgi:hypothetical protein